MSSDGKFFIGVIAVAILAVVGFVVFGGKSSEGDAVIDTTIGQKLGSDSAIVKIVEFGDFQCPACRAAAAPLKQAYGNNQVNVQLIYRHIPLPIHPNADEAAQAAEAAGLQGKFWEMYDLLFAEQDSWSTLADPKAQLETYAQSLGLDLDKFRSDYGSSAVADAIARDKDASDQAGVSSTPTFFINGERIIGAQSAEQWQEIIDRKIAETVPAS
ncbi:MAG: thioredoxin domain-containing protein [Patescibacteria group bacterium]